MDGRVPLSPRRVSAVSALSLALALAGCGVVAGPPSSPSPNPFVALCAEPVVKTCGTDPLPTGITIADDARDADVLAFAARVQEAIADEANEITLHADAPDAVRVDPEVSPAPKWQFTLRPGGRPDRLADILEAAAVPGARGIAVDTDWPVAVAATLDDVEPLIVALSQTRLFSEGGTFTVPSIDEHFRLVYVPEHTTLDGVRAIVSVARDYPDAEILLEAPTTGPQHPTFYVSRLTAEEVTAVDERLRAPEMASASADGIPLEYVLGSIGEQGTTYVTGTFGGVTG